MVVYQLPLLFFLSLLHQEPCQFLDQAPRVPLVPLLLVPLPLVPLPLVPFLLEVLPVLP